MYLLLGPIQEHKIDVSQVACLYPYKSKNSHTKKYESSKLKVSELILVTPINRKIQ